jgi:hypothetical protein
MATVSVCSSYRVTFPPANVNTIALESKKRPALAAKKRPVNVRRPIAARNAQPHLAESPSPMPSFSSTSERQSYTVETNTAPLSATEGSEPVPQG